MLRILLILTAAAAILLKLFTFRHLSPEDGTATLYAGAWTGGVNLVEGPLPVPPERLFVLASEEGGGFAFAPLYAAVTESAWLIVAFCVIGVLLLGILRPRYGVRY